MLRCTTTQIGWLNDVSQSDQSHIGFWHFLKTVWKSDLRSNPIWIRFASRLKAVIGKVKYVQINELVTLSMCNANFMCFSKVAAYLASVNIRREKAWKQKKGKEGRERKRKRHKPVFMNWNRTPIKNTCCCSFKCYPQKREIKNKVLCLIWKLQFLLKCQFTSNVMTTWWWQVIAQEY